MNTAVLDSAQRPTLDASQPRVPVRPAASPAPAGTAATADGPRLEWAKQPSRGLWLGIAALHLGVGWAVAHSMIQPVTLPKSAPVEVRLVDPPRPKPPLQMPVEVKLAVVVPMPLVQPPPVNLAQQVVVTVAETPQPPGPVKPVPVATAAPVTVAAPAAGPREIPASAVRYVSPPQPHMPRMSRKLGESGTVVLHIVVDASGVLRSARVQKSSGFDRLDQQALQDIRSARFAPYLEKGQPVDWEADAGLQYELTER